MYTKNNLDFSKKKKIPQFRKNNMMLFHFGHRKVVAFFQYIAKFNIL